MTAGRRTATDDAVTTAVELVVRGIALAPLIATVIGLTSPAVLQDLSSAESARRLTLLGMVGQFDGLESAIGVVPLVLILVAALLLQLVGAVVLLLGTDSGPIRAPSWLPSAVAVTGGLVVVVTLLLVPVLASADDVSNPRPPVPNPYGLTGIGWAHLTLAGVVAIAAGWLIHSARAWLE